MDKRASVTLILLVVLIVMWFGGFYDTIVSVVSNNPPGNPAGRFTGSTVSTIPPSSTIRTVSTIPPSSTLTTVPGYSTISFPPSGACEDSCDKIHLNCGSCASCGGGSHCHAPPPGIIGWLPDWALDCNICPPACTICMPRDSCDRLGILSGDYTNEQFRSHFISCYGGSRMTADVIGACCSFIHEYAHACNYVQNKACWEKYAEVYEKSCYDHLTDYFCAGWSPIWTTEKCKSICTSLATFSPLNSWDSCICDETLSTSGKADSSVCCDCLWECEKNSKGNTLSQLPPSCAIYFPPNGPQPTLPAGNCRDYSSNGNHKCSYYGGPGNFNPSSCSTTTTTTTTTTLFSTTTTTTPTQVCDTYCKSAKAPGGGFSGGGVCRTKCLSNEFFGSHCTDGTLCCCKKPTTTTTSTTASTSSTTPTTTLEVPSTVASTIVTTTIEIPSTVTSSTMEISDTSSTIEEVP